MTKPSLDAARSVVLFVAGLAGFAHELLIGKAERPTLLILAAGMMGLPAFIGKDSKDAKKESE